MQRKIIRPAEDEFRNLEETFLRMLNDNERTRAEAIEMMRSSAFSEKTKEKYRNLYVKWKSTHQEKKK